MPRNQTYHFFSRLRQMAWLLKWRVGFELTLKLCSVWVTLLVIMVMLNLLFGFSGFFCFWSFLGISVLALCLLLVELFLWPRKKMDAVAGALFFEESCGRDDSLVCAAETIERQKSGVVLNPIEESLLAQMESQSDSLKVLPQLFSRRFFPFKVWFLLLFLSLVFTTFYHSAYWAKGEFYLTYRFLGGAGGLEVVSQDVEVEYGQDVDIIAKITKGKNQAYLLYQVDSKKEEKLEMSKDGDSQVATIFNIQSPVEYMVVTPLVRSKRYTITPYLSPQIERFSVKVFPPKYTGIKPFTLNKLADIRLPQASHCVIDVVTNKKVTVGMTFGKSERVSDKFAKRHQFKMKIDKDYDVSLSGKDGDGRTFKPSHFKFLVSEDLPPVITVFDPALDSQAMVNGFVNVNLGVVDEYGVRDVKLNWFVSKGKVHSVSLFPSIKETVTKEVNLSYVLDLAKLQVKPGDFISFFISASDNCQPKANHSESRLYFVEVRPKDDKKMDKNKAENNNAKSKNAPLKIDDLVAELKRLIRRSWEWRRPDSRTDEEVNKLSQRMSDLRIMSRKRLDELLAKVGIPKGQGGKVEALFEAAISNIKRAENLLQKGLVEESQGFQRRALSDFIKVALELEKNAKKAQGKGKGKKNTQQKQDSQEKTKKQTRRQKMDKMKNVMKQLEQLEDDQATLQRTLQNAQRKDTASNQSHRLAQQQIAGQAKRLADKLHRMESSTEAETSLRQAIAEMKRTAEELLNNEPQKGARHAKRAHRHLSSTRKLLRQKYSKEAGEMLDGLKQIAMELAAGQQKIQQKTEAFAKQKPPESEADKLLDHQQQWNRNYKSLEKAINSTADELDEKHRPIAQELQDLLEKAAKDGLAKQMKRAEKSLLYRRFGRATKSQNNVVQQFQQMAMKLDELAARMPRVDQEELLKALAKINQNKMRVQQLKSSKNCAQKGKLKQSLKQKLSDELAKLGGQIKSSRMKRLAKLIQSMNMAGEGNEGVEPLMELLNTASRTIERQLMTERIKKIAEDQRMFSAPPREYEKLVEEYFKSLTE